MLAGRKFENPAVNHVNDTDKVIAFHRWENRGAGDDVVVIANFANRGYYSYSVGLPRAGLWRVRFNGDWRGYSSAFTNFASYDLQTSVKACVSICRFRRLRTGSR